MRAAIGAAAASAFALMLLAAPVLAQAPGQNTFSETKHNLASDPRAPASRRDLGEMCVFCHTPAGSRTPAARPLWNRTAVGDSYQTYQDVGGGTLDGLAATPVGSVSLACLSCHDGTQALDVNPRSIEMVRPPSGAGPRIAKGGGRLAALARTAAGDISLEHPIGVPYLGVEIAGDRAHGEFARAAKHPTLNRWWVDTQGGTGARDKTDLVLYTRDEGQGEQPFVECASCHDPHSSNPLFLRIANHNSEVCLACHVK